MTVLVIIVLILAMLSPVVVFAGLYLHFKRNGRI